MKHFLTLTYWLSVITLSSITSCNTGSKTAAGETSYSKERLPAPNETKSTTRFSKVLGWPKDKTPIAPAGFIVTRFADGLDNPRWIHQSSNGDVFVAESNTILSGLKKLGANIHPRIKTHNYGSSANRITIFKDTNKDGIYETRSVFLEGLNQPLGMLILNNYFYVANTDGLVQYRYKVGDQKVSGSGRKIVELPAGGYNNHWTRNIISNPQGTKILSRLAPVVMLEKMGWIMK